MDILKIKAMVKAGALEQALRELENLIAIQRENPYLWNFRGDLIQLLDTSDGPSLSEAEQSYLKALEINGDDLDL